MSSLLRRIQRTVERAKNPHCRAPHYMGRGSKLGVKNPPRPKRKKAPKVRPAAEQSRAARKVLKAKMKARVAVTYRAPTRAERQEDHRNKMRWKADERARRYVPNRATRTLANLSRNHPDHGCSPAEHARRKAERLT